jgi:hypothetical protein
MKMVWNQRPSVTGRGSFCKDMTELINKGFSIDIILKNISSLDSSANNMMQGSGGVYAGLAGHSLFISQIKRKETHNFMTVPLFFS